MYNAATLGVFNQAMAVYIFFSMFAVGGVHLSALKRVAEDHSDKSRVQEIALSALLLTFVCSTVATILFWFLHSIIADLLQSPGVDAALRWISPALFFFGINKTLLAIVNGLGEMKSFAVFQSLRYVNLLVAFALAVALQFPGERLAGVFSFSEIILFVLLARHLRHLWHHSSTVNWPSWMRRHALFGGKSVLSGALLELNSKVDVLMLGYFLSDRLTGIYSFAAMLYEGFLQFTVVLQNNYNPHLSKYAHENKLEDLLKTFRHGARQSYKAAILCVPLLIIAYPLAIHVVFANQADFLESAVPFAILMSGLLVSAGYLPFQNLLVMSGHPGWHTGFISLIVLSNALLAWWLIPLFGLTGAAAAVALSLVGSNILLAVFVRRVLHVWLL